jgi:hypothetical protein
MRRAPLKTAIPVDLEALGPTLVAALEARGMLGRRELGQLGVPKSQLEQALAWLGARDFETIRRGVRIPLRVQVLRAVAERRAVSLRELSRLVCGSTASEVKTVAVQLAKEGTIRIVLRTQREVLVSPHLGVLDRNQLRTLGRIAATLAAQCRKAAQAKAYPLTLLQGDIREALSEFLMPPADASWEQPPVSPGVAETTGGEHTTSAESGPPNPSPDQAGPPRASLVPIVVAELARSTDPSVGLGFVPTVVRALQAENSVKDLQTALLEAVTKGQIELRPDAGLGRFSQEELDLCPPGPEGSRLAWARVLGTGPGQ